MASDNCFITLNGPYCFGPNLAVGYRVFRFVPSSHTWSPSLYRWNLLFPGFCIFITFCALAICSRALFRILSNSEICIATAGRWFGPSTHSTFGVYPMIRSNGDFFVVALGHELCANSANASQTCQSSCRSSHQNLKNCSTHWFVLSDCPSVFGWYAVEMFWCIFSALHSALANFDVSLVLRSEMIFLGTPNLGNM
jgi:hypothetical protein